MKRTSKNTGQRRSSRAAADGGGVGQSATSTQSNDRDVLSIIQQDDQELAEAKLNAKRQLQQSGEPVAAGAAAAESTSTANSGVSSNHSESQQEQTPQSEPKGRLTTQLPAHRRRSSKQPPKETISLPVATGPSHEVDLPPAPKVPRQTQSTSALRHPQSTPQQTRVDKEISKNASGKDNEEEQYQYENQAQAMAVKLAFRESQMDAQDSMHKLVLPSTEELIEDRTHTLSNEEEKEEEQAPDDNSEFQDEPVTRSISRHRHAWRTQQKQRAAPLSGDSNHSQPGAFRVGVSTLPAVGIVVATSSGEDDNNNDDDDWDDAAQLTNIPEERSPGGSPAGATDDEASLLDKSEISETSGVPEFDEIPLSDIIINNNNNIAAENAPTTASDADGNILVEATLVAAEPEDVEPGNVVVPEPELVKAQPLEETLFTPREMFKTRAGRLWAIGIGFFFFIVILGLSLGLGLRKDDTKQVESMVPTMAPTSFVEDLLPEVTQEALLNSSTPQAEAYEWYTEDLGYRANVTSNMNSSARDLIYQAFVPVQRFALATIYHSLQGGHWDDNKGWLEFDTPECDWANTFLGSVCPSPSRRELQTSLRGVAGIDQKRHLQETKSGRSMYTQLSLLKNGLKGQLPPEIMLLSTLDVVNIHENEISGTIPSELGLLKHVTQMQVFKNVLTGALPTELGSFPKIKALNFAYNSLKGPLPSELGQLHQSLESLSFSNNPIEGTLPTELGLLTTADRLFFYANPYLTGPIPSTLGKLGKNLRSLQLDSANYTGSLPTEFGMLSNLEDLSLHDNRELEGPIPTELGGLTKLTSLKLFNTGLTGTVPMELCGMLNQTNVSLSVDCDQVTCLCDIPCDCSQSSSMVPENEWETDSPIVEEPPGYGDDEFQSENPIDFSTMFPNETVHDDGDFASGNQTFAPGESPEEPEVEEIEEDPDIPAEVVVLEGEPLPFEPLAEPADEFAHDPEILESQKPTSPPFDPLAGPEDEFTQDPETEESQLAPEETYIPLPNEILEGTPTPFDPLSGPENEFPQDPLIAEAFPPGESPEEPEVEEIEKDPDIPAEVLVLEGTPPPFEPLDEPADEFAHDPEILESQKPTSPPFDPLAGPEDEFAQDPEIAESQAPDVAVVVQYPGTTSPPPTSIEKKASNIFAHGK